MSDDNPHSTPDTLAPFLTTYAAMMTNQFPNLVYGVYCHGSLALNAFNPQKSDINFVTVTHQPFSTANLRQLTALHKELARSSPWGKRMDGHYLYLPSIEQNKRHTACPTVQKGKYIGARRLADLHYHILALRGLTIWGAPAIDVFKPVPWQTVIREMGRHLDEFGHYAAQHPFELLRDDKFEKAVLTTCRTLYACERLEIVSKCQAAEHALNILPARWHALVQEALRLRTQTEPNRIYLSRWERMRDTQAFVREMAIYVNQVFLSSPALIEVVL